MVNCWETKKESRLRSVGIWKWYEYAKFEVNLLGGNLAFLEHVRWCSSIKTCMAGLENIFRAKKLVCGLGSG